jgi:homocysteine S-methyltransferase
MAATRVARRSGLPWIISLASDGEGRLLSGEDLVDTASSLWEEGAEAVAVNCVPARKIGSDVRRLATAAANDARAFGAYANILDEEDDPEEYAGRAAEWLVLGARLIGGCCGTTPDHTAALRRLLAGGASSAGATPS